MSRGARAGLLAATIIGVAIAGWTIGAVGLRQVASAMATIGWLGMLVFVLWSLGVLTLLGLAWYAVAPDEPPARIRWFIWARTTREAATDVLPFSQLGGIVVGVRTLLASGVPAASIYASMIADLTTEMAAQLLFTLAGVAALLGTLAHLAVADQVVPLALAGLGGMAAMVAAFAFAQRPMLTLAGRIGARFLPGSVGAMAEVRTRLDAIYRRPVRVIAAFLLNLLAWIASAAGAWIALSFMGRSPSLWVIVALEALIFTVRSVAFMIPGAIGVQEAVYALLGPIFGLPPTTAIALSLLKRARDLLVGIPALLLWQAGETAGLVGGAAATSPSTLGAKPRV